MKLDEKKERKKDIINGQLLFRNKMKINDNIMENCLFPFNANERKKTKKNSNEVRM